MSEFEFIVCGEKVVTSVDTHEDDVAVRVGDREYTFRRLGDSLFQLQIDGQFRTIAAIKHEGVYYIDIDSIVIEVNEAGDEQLSADASGHAAEKDKVYAPMPGKIVKILVKNGDRVKERQPLIVVEAMKMENQVNSPASGKVKAINFSVGEQVDTLSPIVELEISS